MSNKPEFDTYKSANLLATINANVDNDKLSDADFRQFIRNSIPVAIVTKQNRTGYTTQPITRKL